MNMEANRRREYEYGSYDEYRQENPVSMANSDQQPHSEIAMVANVDVNGVQTKTLFDTGTRGTNIVSKTFVQAHRIGTTPLEQPVTINMTTKGSKTTAYEQAVIQVVIRPGQAVWNVTCDLLPINAYDLILGIPFMHKHQTKIDMAEGTIYFPSIRFTLKLPQQPMSASTTRTPMIMVNEWNQIASGYGDINKPKEEDQEKVKEWALKTYPEVFSKERP